MCSLFEGFMDFLSAATLGLETGDSLVLNSVANVGKAVNTWTGTCASTAFSTVTTPGGGRWKPSKGHYGGRVCDCSVLYDGCKDLNEYLQLTAKMNNNLKIKGQ